MRSELLESWGESLIAAAKAQRQIEHMMEWASRWHTVMCEAMFPFAGAMGRERKVSAHGREPTGCDACNEPAENLRRIFSSYLKLFGFVPMEEYLELARRYEELKERCAAQEEALKHLNMLLQGHGGITGSGLIMKQFQDLALKQKENYQKLVEGFIELFDGGK